MTIHGFYLCMMGTRYNSGNDGGYRTLWPGQYAWLLNNSLVSWKDHKNWGLSKEDISDKNKADGLVKLAALLQEKPKDIVTASFVSLPQMTPAQWTKFESLAMENTYDVSHQGQEHSDAIAWYIVPRDYRDDEVGVMEEQEQHLGESVSLTESDGQKAEPAVVMTEEDASVITEWDANLYMTRYWPLLCLLGAWFGAIHLVS
ncbi:hypothetical protein NXS19_005807 [Fusarium pseudograminearum]|nr:hypothetical protein NXS19_005807 [Fusarium pseudograminearum]